MNFQSLKNHLASHVREIISILIPGGKMQGQEYVAGSIMGGSGDSFKFNVNKGMGSDFATSESYDIISLYAAVNNIPNIEAAKQLAEKYGYREDAPDEPEAILPPENSTPDTKHYKYGNPVAMWCYKTKESKPLFYVCRYTDGDGKQFFPYTYFSDGKWKQRAWPIPRPLYNLDVLHLYPDRPVLLVEGEKAADSAQKIVGDVYVVTTWSNGAQAFPKSKYDVLKGRRILIWPDNDAPGIKCARQIENLLSPLCPQIKTIDPSDKPEGWDAADALQSGWTWNEFKNWAAPRTNVYDHVLASKTPVSASETVEATLFTPKPDLPPKTAQINVNFNPMDDNGKVSGSLMSLWTDMGIAMAGNGQPICNIDNAVRIYESWPDLKDFVWYDEFYQRLYTTYGCAQGVSREWTDDDDLSLTLFMQRTMGLRRMSDEQIHKAIRVYAHQNKRNEPLDWLNGLVWDTKPRIETFLQDCAGSPDNEYTRAISRNFWISMVARAFRPGCQVDTMLILEGKQGTRKSTLLETIAGKWHASVKEAIDSNNFFMAFQGKLILEFADLSTFHRAELNRLKQIITDRVDRYRSPYDRHAQDHPRQCIFAGTTNDHVYLEDPTGARRFWPVKTTYINIPLVIASRAQLFAEAVFCFKNAYTWHEVPDTAIDEQEQRRHVDPWEHLLTDYVAHRMDITTNEIMSNCLHIEPSRQTRSDEIRIGRILKLLGLERKRKRIGDELRWVYNHEEVVSDEVLVNFED